MLALRRSATPVRLTAPTTPSAPAPIARRCAICCAAPARPGRADCTVCAAGLAQRPLAMLIAGLTTLQPTR